MGRVPHALVIGVLSTGMGGMPGVVHVAVAVGGHALMTGVRRTAMTRLPRGRRLFVVRVAVIAMLPGAVGVLIATVWWFVGADVTVRLVGRPFALGTFLHLRRGGVRAVVGLCLMDRPALLSAATAAVRDGVGGVVPGAVMWSVPCVGVMLTRRGMAGRGLVG
ncbi:hypothetical protein ACGFI9_32325 [Micromonospora sp. NPDC048930]|uniref:hypothetical protein n=1 Tax=Micromonospora sp. NPDC048930 TaxID=3364261 RepID=UPI0037175F7F